MRHREARMGLSLVVLFLWLLGGAFVGVPSVPAEDSTVELNSPDVLRQLLEQQVGKRVKIKLLSGQDLDGKVARVGTQAVLLSELSGMEFFDATLRLDQVAAVVVKVRTK
ncbi:MAG: hypothetical protein H8K05_14035 [Nitrospira sp.]|nr:hypothetical protein [Nitrospira sp.]MCS6318862.1 hypothetical protein [Nitrospira sp.]